MMVNEEVLLQPFLKIHPEDNVLVALKDLPAGTTLSFDNNSLVLQQDVAAKHKFFIREMELAHVSVYQSLLIPKTFS